MCIEFILYIFYFKSILEWLMINCHIEVYLYWYNEFNLFNKTD